MSSSSYRSSRRDFLIDPIARAQSHQTRIDSLWDWDDPAESERRFRAAAESERGLDGEILITQVARAVGLQGRFDAAAELLDELPDDEDEELRVRVLLERGRALNSSGDTARAGPEFEAALEAAEQAGFEHLAVDAIHMLAIVAAAADQDELNGRALELASTASDPRARQWRASLLNNMGWTAFERGDLAGALKLFEDALAARLEQGKQSEIIAARWCVARTLREIGRVDEALAIQLTLADDLRAAGKTDHYVDEEIAACRAALNTAATGTTASLGTAAGAAATGTTATGTTNLNQDDATSR
jgi:tetratricopeptide (TPR) repeat protein